MQRFVTSAVLAAALATPALADLKPGDKAPDFSTQAYTAGQAHTFKLSEALKKGPVVIYFFPAAYTAGCNIETHMFSEAADQFKAQKATLVGITAGNVDKIAEYSKDTQYCAGKFALLADPGAKIARQFDTNLAVPAEMRARMNLPETLSNRTSYVVAPGGKVLLAYTDRAPQDHVAKTLDAVKDYRAKAK
jgi:thioredoxin-dependent peroxiredoxin